MKVAVVIPVLNQHPIAKQAIEFLSQETPLPYEVIVFDNGSDEQFKMEGVNVYKSESPVGSYPVFHAALDLTDADVIAFFHSDFFVYDKDWYKRVIEEFEKDSKLALIGFIGSNEIDALGGRGGGTMSNFQGRVVLNPSTVTGDGSGTPGIWKGSPAVAHGKHIPGEFRNAAVVDGCSMILRRTALEQIGERENFPPHHFYDRLISTQLLELGWKIGVLGVACDHVSGQTANQESKWQDFAKEWCVSHNILPSSLGVNWDQEVYKEAERQWLTEYRDLKHFIPRKAV